jgi:hypothetical protein
MFQVHSCITAEGLQFLSWSLADPLYIVAVIIFTNHIYR